MKTLIKLAIVAAVAGGIWYYFFRKPAPALRNDPGVAIKYPTVNPALVAVAAPNNYMNLLTAP